VKLAGNEEATGPHEQQQEHDGLIQSVQNVACHSMLILQCGTWKKAAD
jgi:hypothetical protein